MFHCFIFIFSEIRVRVRVHVFTQSEIENGVKNVKHHVTLPAFGQWFSYGGNFVRTPCFPLCRLFMIIFALILSLERNRAIRGKETGILCHFSPLNEI